MNWSNESMNKKHAELFIIKIESHRDRDIVVDNLDTISRRALDDMKQLSLSEFKYYLN